MSTHAGPLSTLHVCLIALHSQPGQWGVHMQPAMPHPHACAEATPKQTCRRRIFGLCEKPWAHGSNAAQATRQTNIALELQGLHAHAGAARLTNYLLRVSFTWAQEWQVHCARAGMCSKHMPYLSA